MPYKVVNCVHTKNGHYVIIKGSLQGQQILPAHPSEFVSEVLLHLAEMATDTVIVDGDFNCTLNPLIDVLIAL